MVTEADDPFLCRMLAVHEQITGIPVMINTSFDLHDEPLVSNARDALAAFFLAELDVLFLEGAMIELADNHQVARHVDLTRRSGHDVLKLSDLGDLKVGMVVLTARFEILVRRNSTRSGHRQLDPATVRVIHDRMLAWREQGVPVLDTSDLTLEQTVEHLHRLVQSGRAFTIPHPTDAPTP